MKKFKIYTLVFSIIWLASCDSLLNVNDDPSRIGPDEATIQTLLPSAIRYTGTAMYGSAQYGAQYPQYLSGQAISQYTPYGFDQLWNPLYTDVVPTVQDLIARSEAAGAYNYAGIGKTLLALNLMTATDVFGDVPYTQANKGTANLNPCYDLMEDLYGTHIIALLNAAIEDLAKPLPELASLRAVTNDYIYSGSLDKWTRAARALRARYYLHLSEKDPSLLEDAIADAQASIQGYADDFQLAYEDLNANPWFGFLGNATNKIMQPSSYLVDLMNGAGYFTGAVDPRLPVYMTKPAAAATYIGLPAGAAVNSSGANVNVTATNWHFRAVAPIQFITYAEVQFILAEALFNTDKEASYQAYLRGIEASIAKVGATGGAAYLSHPEIAVTSANLTLADIMLQKYIALYLQIETWTDMRRYQYDPAVYVGLQKPIDNQIPGNPWIQRSKVADNEVGVNTCIPNIPNQGVPLWLFE
jgi:hypothetical protein